MFSGKHYETGTVANALAAMGSPLGEALALGASGGIAFGYFVFEYKGDLPYVALLTRNTFAPFERMLDNLAIRREARETTDPARAERNLRIALDDGHFPVIWADSFSLPYLGLVSVGGMWMMRPLLVVGHEGDDFLVVDGDPEPIRISAADLATARAKVKKDRNRMILLERPDPERLAEGLGRGIDAAVALMLDKPPVGSADNFGIQGMRAFAKALTDARGPKAWRTKFEPGPRLVQALAGRVGQPGVWDWIETWGTAPGGDRSVYAAFLREAGPILGRDLGSVADRFDASFELWRQLAGQSMPDTVPEFDQLKRLKLAYATHRSDRPALRENMTALTEALGESVRLAECAQEIQATMADMVLQIAEIEFGAFSALRGQGV